MNAYSIASTTPLSFGLQPNTRDSASTQKRKARILVVDDDPGLLRLLTIRLRAENYEVEAVESAAAALAACVRFRPDLVITDLRMDQMDGIGLLKELQSRWPGLRVMMLARQSSSTCANPETLSAFCTWSSRSCLSTGLVRKPNAPLWVA